MENNLSISSYCRISNHRVVMNDCMVGQGASNEDLKDFQKALYQLIDVDYPKYFKMDTLCKLAFAAAELLLKDSKFLSTYPKDKIGILLSNTTSSLDTDRKHQATITDKEHYFPSPSLFVYTLPSIMCGEIAIRHGIQGENSFFITDNFSPALLAEQLESLFKGGYVKACIAGWVDMVDGKEDVLLFLVERGGEMELTEENLKSIYG